MSSAKVCIISGMVDGYVTVHKTSDPVEAEMLEELLRDGGLDVRLLGTRNAALLGAAQHIMSLRLEVPAEQQEQAQELLKAYTAKGELSAEQPEVTASTEEEKDWAQHRERLSHVKAGGATIVIFGGSHMYARRPYTSLFLALGQLLALAGLLFGSYLEHNAATMLFFGLLLFDLVFGQLAIRAWNRGERAGKGKQALSGLVAVMVLGTLGVLLAPHYVPRPSREDLRFRSFVRPRPHLVPALWRGASHVPPKGPSADDEMQNEAL
jgi:hypothetical protein